MRRLLYLYHADPTPFRKCFDEAKLLFDVDRKTIGRDDVIYYGGGTDVNPELYGEKLHFFSAQPDKFRDEYEQKIFHEFSSKVKGFIGVCRGSQFLTVMNGGKLVQHIGMAHCGAHQIITNEGALMKVTSTHHQMMYPFNLPAEDYKILATPNPDHISRCYQRGDGHGEYVGKDIPVEPEIVWYPKSKSLCIQGHPEYMHQGQPFPSHCRNLINERLLS